MPHEAEILKALKKGKKLTKLGVLKQFGCMNLGGRIFDLKQKGHKITTKMITRNGKRYAQYYLSEC